MKRTRCRDDRVSRCFYFAKTRPYFNGVAIKTNGGRERKEGKKTKDNYVSRLLLIYDIFAVTRDRYKFS